MYRSVSLVLIVALASVHTTLALPTAESVYPEVIPGPGLPTLAELGLTSAELYQMKPKPGPEPLVAGFQPTCGIEDRAAVNDVIACFNYLTSVGNNACVIPRGKSQSSFCTSGSAEIVGSATGEATSGESSSCYDVSLAVQYVFNNCNSNGQVSGEQAAYGNGDLTVIAANAEDGCPYC